MEVLFSYLASRCSSTMYAGIFLYCWCIPCDIYHNVGHHRLNTFERLLHIYFWNNTVKYTHTQTHTKKQLILFTHESISSEKIRVVYFFRGKHQTHATWRRCFLIRHKLSTCFTSAMMVAVTATAPSSCQGQTGNNRGIMHGLQQSYYFSHFYIWKIR